MMARRPALFALRALAPLLVLAGAGCSRDEPAPSTQEEQEEAAHVTATLAAAIARDPRISETARLLSRTGISQMLDGAGSYTILAPVDDAFGSPPPRNESTDDTAQAIALLRRHILPGYITIADIESALAREADGTALMRVLNGGFVRFAKKNGAITVTDQAGISARLSTDQIFAANGVAIPLDQQLPIPR